ncbi:MAG: polysaccharide biosynthesis/export family protein [Candidatus Symbiothrix sp.]|jgi:polysaccharide export outer membrane protein|nr:polysaccharide biosynthesis/export family protein [Candidatus Symbiothrix sp.]
MKINFLALAAVTVLLFSCQSTPKNIAYFQNLDEYVEQNGVDESNFDPIVKIGDQLLITVSAPVLDQTLVAQFNLPANTFMSSGTTSVSQTPNLQTYPVNIDGSIDYPVLGRISVAGQQKSRIIKNLTGLVSQYVEDAIVNLQIISYRVVVLGEVNRPGPVLAQNERLTLLEAIGQAGDLTVFGKRENVLLIREINGQKQFARLDLTKAELFSSPFYYLQQNDVIVVESNDTRKRASKFGASESYNLSIYSAILSTVSVLASTIVTIISLRNK